MINSYKSGATPVQLPARSVLSDEIHAEIMELLLTHEIAPGENINIDALAKQLNVSRTPVREALARLESEDLVAKKPLRGYTATALLTAEQVDDLFQFRALIEPWSAAHAAQRHTPEDAEAIRAELARGEEYMKLDVDQAYAKMSDHDKRFHELIAQVSGSDYARDAFERMHCHLHLFRLYQNRKTASDAAPESGDQELFGLYYEPATGFHAFREHSNIAEAILAGDADRAQALMLAHIEGSRERNLQGARLLNGS